MTDQQPQPQQAITPAPTPFTLVTQTLTTPSGNIVLLTLHTVTGMVVLFADPKTAIAMGQQLLREGRQAATGLVLPPGSSNGHGVLLSKDE